MSSNRELLELAAKAAGLVGYEYTCTDQGGYECMAFDEGGSKSEYWNPLEDDGDAFRLAAELFLGVSILPGSAATSIEFYKNTGYFFGGKAPHIQEDHGSDKLSATRRAIVMAAASIGKKLP